MREEIQDESQTRGWRKAGFARRRERAGGATPLSRHGLSSREREEGTDPGGLWWLSLYLFVAGVQRGRDEETESRKTLESTSASTRCTWRPCPFPPWCRYTGGCGQAATDPRWQAFSLSGALCGQPASRAGRVLYQAARGRPLTELGLERLCAGRSRASLLYQRRPDQEESYVTVHFCTFLLYVSKVKVWSIR